MIRFSRSSAVRPGLRPVDQHVERGLEDLIDRFCATDIDAGPGGGEYHICVCLPPPYHRFENAATFCRHADANG